MSRARLPLSPTLEPRRPGPTLAAALAALLLTSPLVGTLHGQTPPGRDEAEWDVTDPPFPMEEVELDVTRGTWMNVDVSPDGEEIAFDLLGDIYVIPLEGGDARPLTGDFAWNMQPRYSPDGRWIAFTSDRGGGDNIWVMRRDGSDLREVTNETFRLLNGPAWSPDSEYIVARKHFTGTRSLGAGEMWLYHRTGGTGIQLTERPNDQKDVNEPAFSPDGRHLYFSQDVTPGDVFEYNKDSNAGIYAIRRLDRESGRLVNYVTGPGGAVRPTPSPDGRYLAFVRRVRFQSTLFLRDLESGREWPIHDGLERDMQEIWAIHGVYPTMAWTPDAEEIVFWAGGGIHRIHVESGEVTEIPFRVRDTRRVAETVRTPRRVHPDSFDVRMLRWVEVSPAGDRVVYSAMGHLYFRDLPEGEPRRLTAQEEHFEYYPSFSRDGRQVVYVSWDDEELAAVRVISADGGEGRIVTRERGHYAEPVFSPDGETIVYRRITGGGVVSPLWSADPGIYHVPATGGESTLVTRSGSQPRFGRSNDRFFFQDSDAGQQALKSIALDGSDERTHLRSQWATQFSVSPEERWVAWVERYQAYVRPFPPTGTPVDITPGGRDLPQRRVSRDAGTYLHWAGNGGALHWSLGPELFTLDMAEAFDHLDAQREEVDLPLAEGRHIGFQEASDQPTGVVALEGARVITMRDEEVLEDGVVLVEGNRIAAVGTRADVEIPPDAHRQDLSGHTILPGFIDVHWHGPHASGQIVPRTNHVKHASLAFGVTTVHNPSAGTEQVFTASEMIRSGRVTGPRTYSTGTILYGATTASTAEVESLDDALAHLRRLSAAGAFSVKSYNQPRRDQRQQILEAAREEGMLVVPEGGALFEHNMSMVADGHSGIEHSLPLENVYDDVLRFWGSTGAGYTPTLVVAFGGLWGENYFYHHDDVWENERLMAFSPPLQVEARARRRTKAPEEEYNHIRTAAHARDLLEAGVGVQLGAHGQRSGLDAHWELWSFVLGGMTPHQALRVATLNGARYLGMDEDLGSLEPGKLADLIVLEADPLDDIRNSERIRYTMVNGRIYDARTMDEVGNHPRSREAFYWEDWGWR